MVRSRTSDPIQPESPRGSKKRDAENMEPDFAVDEEESSSKKRNV